MNRFLLLLVLLLTACSAVPVPNQSLEIRMQNPLFAERYSAEMLETLANLFIHEDPILKDAAKKKPVEQALAYWREETKRNRAEVKKGIVGRFVTVSEDTSGTALVTLDHLYLGSDFLSLPGGDLRVYISTIVDPRQGTFPDAGAVEIGQVQTVYGEQTFTLPELPRPATEYYTVTLFDVLTGRIYGFAQLNPA